MMYTPKILRELKHMSQEIIDKLNTILTGIENNKAQVQLIAQAMSTLNARVIELQAANTDPALSAAVDNVVAAQVDLTAQLSVVLPV